MGPHMRRSGLRRPLVGPGVTLLIAAVLAGCGKGTATAPAIEAGKAVNTVELTADEVAKLGLVTTAVQSAQYSPRSTGYGTVVSLETVAQSFAELKTASAAAAQSNAAASRARSLAGGDEAAVSQEVVEAAQSKALADEATLSLAQRKSDATFGRDAPWRTGADRDRVLQKLAAGRAVLVRVTFPSGASAADKPQLIHVARIGTSEVGWTTGVIWRAPADPTLPGAGFFGLLEGSDLTQGEHVTAWMGVGAPLTGVWIPQAAVLLSESDTWIYLASGSGHFTRVRVDITHPDRDGYFIRGGSGIAAGQRVVTSGAGLLLARELNPGNGGAD
jgi:membrane fusion protein, multidrug efflux system